MPTSVEHHRNLDFMGYTYEGRSSVDRIVVQKGAYMVTRNPIGIALGPICATLH